MPIQKRAKKVWNGLEWVDVYHPTSSDLVTLPGGVTLDAKITEIEGDIGDHIADTQVHVTAAQAAKLENLPADANATFAAKEAFDTHAADEDLHKTAADRTKLSNLPENSNETFATKSELAGKTRTYFFADITERDAQTDEFELGVNDSGITCWVQDPTGDTANIERAGAAQYMWDGEIWQFLFQAGDEEIIHNWSDIVGGPESDPGDIDQAVDDAHTHTNKATVLDKLGVDGDQHLTFDGTAVGLTYNRTYLQDTEPASPNAGDVWLAPIGD